MNIMKKITVLLVVLQLFASCSLFKSSNDLELIPFEQKGKYGYFDLEGKIVINPQFAFATAFREDLALVRLSGDDGKWGYIDKKGKFVINATYKDATVFQDGLAWVVTDNAAPSAIDKDGKIKFTLKQANDVKLFSEGLAGFSVKDTTNNETWGFVDKSGISTVNPQFFDIGDYSESKCAVKNKEGKWGFIDKSGKIAQEYHVKDGKTKTIFISEQENLTSIDNCIFENVIFDKSLAYSIANLLYRHDIQSIIIEGGAKTIQTFVDANLWDEAYVFVGNVSFEEGLQAPEMDKKPVETRTILDNFLKVFKKF